MYICRVEDRIGNGYTGRAAGGSDGRVDRARAELNGNPVQSGGLNRERLLHHHRDDIASYFFPRNRVFIHLYLIPVHSAQASH